jgi:hypothetical protein
MAKAPVGIVICNYNKREFVVECIQSILESRVRNFDIFVVDNGSTDDSVEVIEREFGERVTLLRNKENLGGSGGFNTGLRVVRDAGYRYFMCLDDDACVDENAIDVLYRYMEEHPDVGMAGARVYHREMPEYIQQCGLMLDFRRCTAETLYADCREDGSLPEVVECDTVATCAVMIRGDVIRNTQVGMMPQDNFIYWDDMEWGHRMRQAGYRVVTLGSAKVLHQMGANTKRTNTFLNYYMWRNRTNFFMRYTPKEQMEEMSVHALGSVFNAMYESMYRGEHNIMKTISFAWHDAMAGVRGKAAEYEILPNDANDDKLIRYVQGKKTYCIVENGQEEDADGLRDFLQSVNDNLEEVGQGEPADMVFQMCPYIFKIKDDSLEQIYIDGERNCILDQEDITAVKNYEYNRMLFIYMNQDAFLAAAGKMRS